LDFVSGPNSGFWVAVTNVLSLFLLVGGYFLFEEFGLTMRLDAEFGTESWFLRLRSICLIGCKKWHFVTF